MRFLSGGQKKSVVWLFCFSKSKCMYRFQLLNSKTEKFSVFEG